VREIPEENENDILCGLGMLDVQLTVCIDKMTVPEADLSSITAIMSGLSNTTTTKCSKKQNSKQLTSYKRIFC
jgi:hypothetical protein